MFYEQNQIDENLICPNCNEKFIEPKMLPCGETICNNCITVITKNKKDEFECPLCEEKHDLPSNKNFPTNKTVLKILKKQPKEIEHSDLIKNFKKSLNLMVEKVNEYENIVNDNGTDRINSHCFDLRQEVDLATEKLIDQIQDEREKLLKEINDFEADRIKQLLGNFFKIFSINKYRNTVIKCLKKSKD